MATESTNKMNKPRDAERDAVARDRIVVENANKLTARIGDGGGFLSNLVWNTRNNYLHNDKEIFPAIIVRWLVEGFMSALFAPDEAAALAAKGRETVDRCGIDRDVIERALRDYRMIYSCDEDGAFDVALEDVLKPPLDQTIEYGLKEIGGLADYLDDKFAQLSQHGSGQAGNRISDLIKSAESELLSSQDSEYPDEAFEGRVQARISALYECRHIASDACKSGRADARREICGNNATAF